MHGTISTLENDEILKQLAAMNRINVQDMHGTISTLENDEMLKQLAEMNKLNVRRTRLPSPQVIDEYMAEDSKLLASQITEQLASIGADSDSEP
jgi:type IV secretory pathway ATPase VirB11/archaellum biosynthesis ATPase